MMEKKPLNLYREMLMAVNQDIKREAQGLRTTVRAVDVDGNIFRPIKVRQVKANGWALEGHRITDGKWVTIYGWHNY